MAYETTVLPGPETSLSNILSNEYGQYGYSYAIIEDDFDQLWEFADAAIEGSFFCAIEIHALECSQR